MCVPSMWYSLESEDSAEDKTMITFYVDPEFYPSTYRHNKLESLDCAVSSHMCIFGLL